MGSSPPRSTDFCPIQFEADWILLAYHVGAMVSGLLVSPTISKKFGRRVPIALGTTGVLISVFIQSFAPNVVCFIAGRVLMGLGKGISMNNGPTYIAEIAPTKIRGVMLSLWQCTSPPIIPDCFSTYTNR